MKIGVIIPCYRVSRHVCQVVEALLRRGDIHHIVVVDDGCPEQSGALVMETFGQRVSVVFNASNLGVGGATIEGYKEAIRLGCDVLVKMDGDGQMDPDYLPDLVYPILKGRADYTKGNRFFSLEMLEQMPWVRKLGNAGLSLFSKISSGYWNVMDPTNGYTAIHARVLKLLPLEKIRKHYFFESDMLFRLGTVRAVVKDIPIPSRYADESSGLNVRRTLLTFPWLHLQCLTKRIFYNYFLRDWNAGSMELLLAIPLLGFGILYGGYEWVSHVRQGVEASSGTVMLAALPVILGFQLMFAFLLFDVGSVPDEALHPMLERHVLEH